MYRCIDRISGEIFESEELRPAWDRLMENVENYAPETTIIESKGNEVVLRRLTKQEKEEYINE